jgi:type I restriction enzyme S subunit
MWKKYKLKDIGCSFLSGFAFKSTDYISVGVPLIKIGNIQNRAVRIDELGDFVHKDILNKKISQYLLKNMDVLIAMTGQGSVGRVGRIKMKSNEFALLNQRVGKFACDERRINIDFLFYILASAEYQDALFKAGSGSGQPNLSPELILDFEIPIPPYDIQKAIAEILRSLDDKIDLLHRQNKTLEQLAETLFRQWFVEEAETNWETAILNDVVSVRGGTTPSTSIPEYWDGNIAWTTPRDLSNHKSVFLFDTERKITEKGLSVIGSGLLPIGTVLLSSRAPIGYLAITSLPVAINQGYIAILCDKLVSNQFIYLWCKANLEEIKNAGNGSVFQEISKSTFKQLAIQIPPESILRHFDTTITPIFLKIKANQTQIHTLTNLRDSLLPKLMSGEVLVKSE